MTAEAASRELDPATAERQRWMAALAKASPDWLEESWQSLESRPAYVFLRKAEVGLCMVRGRAGGSGTRFNLGEMTMTRAAVRLASGAVGFGYVAGRSLRHAELAALFDALLQDPVLREELAPRLLAPIEQAELERQDAAAAKAAATRVEFFTLVRGEDAR